MALKSSSSQSRIAAGIMSKHADYLTLNGWDIQKTPPMVPLSYDMVDVELGDTRIACQIADTEELQITGLQRHASLNSGEGMVFPYDPPRKVSFHMAKVAFPIDIVFINGSSKISKIVENIEPGTPGSWGMSHTALVVEVPGGFCSENGISVGDDAGAVSDRVAALGRQAQKHITFGDLDVGTKFRIDHLSPAFTKIGPMRWDSSIDGPFDPNAPHIEWEGDANSIGIYHNGVKALWVFSDDRSVTPSWSDDDIVREDAALERQAQEHFPDYPRKDINPKLAPSNPTRDRFKDRDLVDITTDAQPLDNIHYDQTNGYDVTKDMSDDAAPVRPGR